MSKYTELKDRVGYLDHSMDRTETELNERIDRVSRDLDRLENLTSEVEKLKTQLRELRNALVESNVIRVREGTLYPVVLPKVDE